MAKKRASPKKKAPPAPAVPARGAFLVYPIVLVLLVAGAFTAVTTEWKGKTVFATVRDDVRSRWNDAPREVPKKNPPKRAIESVQREPKAKERVALLRRASEEVAARAERTRVDPKITEAEKKALDDLMTSRVTRGK
jgi:hypothetical protein